MTHEEETFIMLKPETVERGVVGTVLRRFERAGFRFTALDMRTPDRDLAAAHYGSDIADRHGKQVRERAIRHITNSIVVPAILAGPHAVRKVRSLVGESFDPAACSPGTIRGDLSADSAAQAEAADRSILNIVHAADSRAAARAETARWFPSRAPDGR
jgi:nucleoside-diphosphate kinase